MSARIHYAGREYTVQDRDFTQLREEIDAGLRSGEPFWLSARFGEGRSSFADLLITHSSTVVVVSDAETEAIQDVAEETGFCPEGSPVEIAQLSRASGE